MVFKIFNGKVKEWRYAGHDKKIKEWIYAGRKSKEKCKVFISSFSKTLVYTRLCITILCNSKYLAIQQKKKIG